MSKKLLIFFLIIFGQDSYSMIVRCGCNKGCDKIIAGYIIDKVCDKACVNLGGWNGVWSLSYQRGSQHNCDGICR